MRCKTFIAKALIIGIMLKPTPMLSYANTEIPNRYRTLEGERIRIDNSIKGNLKEIEILGNTIQDGNNLKDVQSVGELYIDGNGNPILDKQGNKQYRVDIVTENYDNDANCDEIHKTTIILPTQLQRVADISDRLYWDGNKKRYVIEKHIANIVLDGSDDEGWVLSRNEYSDTYDHFRVVLSEINAEEGVIGHGKPLLSDRFLCTNMSWNHGPHNSITTSSAIRTQIGMTFDMYYYQNLNDFKNWLRDNQTTVWYQLKNPKIIETKITSKLKIPTYDGETHIYMDSENGINSTLKVTVDMLPQIAKEAVSQAEHNNTNQNILLARMYINMLPESLYKDQLQEQLSALFSSDITFEKKSNTSNLDIYINSQNMLSLSLNTNAIIFDNFSGVEDAEKIDTLNLTISSSLPYSLNAYLENEMQNSNKSKAMDKSMLNIKEGNENNYKIFDNIKTKLVLKDNCSKGNNISHSIDLKLQGSKAFEADTYKTVIKFEVEQK